MVKKQINKDEIENLPSGKYEGEICLVDNVLDIEQIFQEINSEKFLGVDTETKPSFKKGVSHKTSLIQIATSKKVYLFRIHKMGFHPLFVDLFENKNITKIGIAFFQDLKELKGEYVQFNPQNIVDLNEWCKKNGFENIGAKNLSAMVLGIKISKKQRVSNWELDVLSEAQLDYAATDAWVCRQIYAVLNQLV
jgi:ribonuclease D